MVWVLRASRRSRAFYGETRKVLIVRWQELALVGVGCSCVVWFRWNFGRRLIWSLRTLIGVDRGLGGNATGGHRRARAGRSGGRVPHRVWTSPLSHTAAIQSFFGGVKSFTEEGNKRQNQCPMSSLAQNVPRMCPPGEARSETFF